MWLDNWEDLWDDYSSDTTLIVFLFPFTHTARGLDCWMLYAWHKQHNSGWSGLYIWCFTSLCVEVKQDFMCVEVKQDFMWATNINYAKNCVFDL